MTLPYIKSEDYARAVEAPEVPGELNYAITVKIIAHLQGVLTLQQLKEAVRELVDGYLGRVGLSYTNGNAVIGVLTCAARELERRTNPTHHPVRRVVIELNWERKRVYDDLLAPYEDQKITENGDVYPDDLFKEDDE